MKRSWAVRLEELETKSKTLNAEERFEIWISELYPGMVPDDIDYRALMPSIAPEFREICLNRYFDILKGLGEKYRKPQDNAFSDPGKQ